MASRRWPLVAAAAAAVAWAVAAAAEEEAHPAAAPADPAVRRSLKCKPQIIPGDNPRVDLEVDGRTQVPLATASVNGTAGRFVVATGHPHTLVSPDFAAKAGLEGAALPPGNGTAGAQARIVRIRSLKVGATDFTDFDIQITSLEFIGRQLERPPDGLLAADVLLAMPLTVDYAAKRLVFGRPADLSGRRALEATVSSHRLMVQGTLDGETVEFVMDTASNPSFLARSAWRGPTEQDRGMEFAAPRAVTLGGLGAEPMKFALGGRSILGLDVFRRGAITLDAPDKKVYVPPEFVSKAAGPAPAAPPAPSPAEPPKAPAEPPKAPAEPPKPLPAALEKQLADFRRRVMDIQGEALKLMVDVLQAQQKAVAAVGVPAEKAAEDLALSRRSDAPLRNYKAALLALAQPLRAVDAKFAALARQVHTLEADSRAADAKPRLAALADQVLSQRQLVQMRIADLLEKAGDCKAAAALYDGLGQALAERNRTAEVRAVKEKMAAAYDKAHDYASALQAYRGLYDAIPAGERSRNLNLMLRLAAVQEKSGDLRGALDMFREVRKNIPPGGTVTNLADKIASLESRVGNTPESPAKPPTRPR
ncbi:MAG: clan AA aspartic protease [Planctomycetes bacterium]|nr:clan AA aspartic protease [Planctomycetota bacterium]